MLAQWNWCIKRGRYLWCVGTAVVFVLVTYSITTDTPVLQKPVVLFQNISTSSTPPCLETSFNVSDDDPLSRLDLRLGRWDSSRTFKTFDYAAMGDLYPEISATNKVCLATQCSMDSLKEILNTASHWAGPISLTVFVVEDEMTFLRAFVMWLLRCQPETYNKLALHVTTPSYGMAILETKMDWAQNCSEKPSFLKKRTNETDAWSASHPYPQNLMRNLARKNCQTQYVYMVDVDIVPSKDMADALEQFLSSKEVCKKCAYVIPTYELDWSAKFPSNKSELLKLAKKKLAVPFHKKVFRRNQLASNLSLWEASDKNESTLTHISHDVTNFELAYEPFYVAPDTVPPHDERFVGYGFTRNTQVYEMFLVGYKFKILSPIFTIHWGLQSIKTRPKWRSKQTSKNYFKFVKFKKELYARYEKDPLHFFTNQTKS